MRIKAVLLWLAVNAVLVSAYIFFFRLDFPERIRIETIRESANQIENLAKQFSSALAPLPMNKENMRKLLSVVEGQLKDEAAVFISDKFYEIQDLYRNEKLLPSNTIFSGMQRDYTSQKFTPNEKEQPSARTYTYMSGTKTKSATFYIFVSDIGEHKICLIYPFLLEKKALIRLGLELLALIALVTIIFASVYAWIGHRKDDEDDKNEDNRETTPKPKAEIEPDSQTSEKAQTAKSPFFKEEILYDAGTELESGNISLPVKGILSEIISNFGLTEISIFIREDGLLAKALTADRNGIRRLKNGNKIQPTVEKELKTSAAFIAMKGEKVLIPIKKDDSLLWAAEIIKHAPLTGSELNAIKSELKNIPEDSFFGKAAEIPMGPSYHEALNAFVLESERTGEPFSLVLIYCFSDIEDLSAEEKASVIKLVAYSGLKKYTGKEDAICIYKHCIAVLLKNTGSAQAHRYIEKIMDFLGRLRLKISEERVAIIKPIFSCASTDTTEAESLLETALKELTEQDG